MRINKHIGEGEKRKHHWKIPLLLLPISLTALYLLAMEYLVWILCQKNSVSIFIAANLFFVLSFVILLGWIPVAVSWCNYSEKLKNRRY